MGLLDRSSSLICASKIVFGETKRAISSICPLAPPVNQLSIVGPSNALRISRNLHVAAALFLLTGGLQGDFGAIYFAGWGIFTGLLIYQHTLVKPNDLSRVNRALLSIPPESESKLFKRKSL